MRMLKLVKYVTAAMMISCLAISCGEGMEKESETVEEETTNMGEQMKVVQPVVDSAYEAAEDGDSSMLNDEKKGE